LTERRTGTQLDILENGRFSEGLKNQSALPIPDRKHLLKLSVEINSPNIDKYVEFQERNQLAGKKLQRPLSIPIPFTILEFQTHLMSKKAGRGVLRKYGK
jgi:hypothetical protein